MKRSWIPLLPLGLPHDDYSPDACEMRLMLYQGMFAYARGKGFHQASGTSPKRKHPRRGRAPEVTRIETLYAWAKYGERNGQSAV